MIWEAVTFALGIGTGVGVMVWHTRAVEAAVARAQSANSKEIKSLRETNQKMRDDLSQFQRNSDCADAYRRGREVGKHSPATAAERFAKAWDGKRQNVTMINRNTGERQEGNV